MTRPRAERGLAGSGGRPLRTGRRPDSDHLGPQSRSQRTSDLCPEARQMKARYDFTAATKNPY
ncbi:MAG: hypothetical protein ACK55Z_30170, partial [bacterium]